MAAFDPKKLTPVDWVVAGGGALALIALFLPWYGWSAGPYSASVSGFSTSYGWLGGLLIVAAGVYLVLQRSQVALPRMSIGPAVALLGIAALGTLIVIIRWLTLPSGHVSGVPGTDVFGVSWGPRIGIYFALIAGLAQVVCAFLLFRASGEKLPWANQPPQAGTYPPAAGPYGPPPGSGQPGAAGQPTGSYVPPPGPYAEAPTPSAGEPETVGEEPAGHGPDPDILIHERAVYTEPSEGPVPEPGEGALPGGDAAEDGESAGPPGI